MYFVANLKMDINFQYFTLQCCDVENDLYLGFSILLFIYF